MRKNRLACAVATAAALAGCSQVIMTAPPGSTVSVLANPTSIPAHGGVSIITAVVMEANGTPVADGTVVQFFTSLGRIDEQGKTNDGVARVNLVSDSRSGTATVTAISGGGSLGDIGGEDGEGGGGAGGIASASIDVLIGNVLPDRIDVVAQPTRLLDTRQAQIVAHVYDENGNALPRIDVMFSVTEPDGDTPAEFERLQSRGNPVFTDNSGRAYDTLRTNYDPAASPRNVVVTARTSNGVEDSVTVGIN